MQPQWQPNPPTVRTFFHPPHICVSSAWHSQPFPTTNARLIAYSSIQTALSSVDPKIRGTTENGSTSGYVPNILAHEHCIIRNRTIPMTEFSRHATKLFFAKTFWSGLKVGAIALRLKEDAVLDPKIAMCIKPKNVMGILRHISTDLRG